MRTGIYGEAGLENGDAREYMSFSLHTISAPGENVKKNLLPDVRNGIYPRAKYFTKTRRVPNSRQKSRKSTKNDLSAKLPARKKKPFSSRLLQFISILRNAVVAF